MGVVGRARARGKERKQNNDENRSGCVIIAQFSCGCFPLVFLFPLFPPPPVPTAAGSREEKTKNGAKSRNPPHTGCLHSRQKSPKCIAPSPPGPTTGWACSLAPVRVRPGARERASRPKRWKVCFYPLSSFSALQHASPPRLLSPLEVSLSSSPSSSSSEAAGR